MGMRGCGKSHLAKSIQTLWPKRVVIDTLDEYPENENTVFDFYSFADRLNQLKESGAQNFEVILKFDDESRVSETEFDEAMRLCYYFGNLQVVIEEIQSHSTPHEIPHWLEKLLLKGRHRNVSILATTQRPGLLNKTILSQCDHVFVGTTIESNDLRYVSAFLGQDVDRLTKLPMRRFLYRGPDGIMEVPNEI